MKSSLKLYLVVFIMLPFLLIAGDEKTVIHPYVSFHNSSTNENTAAFNGDKIYLATKFYGHIYEYNYMADSTFFIDKFKLREKDSNKNTAGAMVYHDHHLYTGTTYAFIRIPEIYIFNTQKDGGGILPETTINCLKYDQTLAVFYNPLVVGNYVYWGTYHDKGGPARLFRLRITDHHYNDKDITIVRSNRVESPKTGSLARINDMLYVATNVGRILRFKLNPNNGSVINELEAINLDIEEASKEIQHLKADTLNNLLWANTTLNNSLFCISNPHNDYEIRRTYHKIINRRIFLGPDEFLYGQGIDRYYPKTVGFKIKRTENGFSYRKFSGLLYSAFGVILGGGYNSQGIPYLIGEDFRRGDQNLDIKFMRHLNLKTGKRLKKEVEGVKINTVGMTLNAFDSDDHGTFYLSTYQAGYMYKINSDFSNKEFLPPGQMRYMYQSDVIKNYPAKKGNMLFGIYGGTGHSSRLIYFDSFTDKDKWKHWILPKGPGGIRYERMRAIAVNPITNDVYVGTSNHLLDNISYKAKIFKLGAEKLNKAKGDEKDWQDLNFHWPGEGIRIDQPGDIFAMASDGRHLYCISQYYDNDSKVRENRFFRVRTDVNNPRINSWDIKTEEKYPGFSGLCDKSICVDGNTLIAGFGNKVFVYDINTFSINNPIKTLKIGIDPVVAILADSKRYYICQPQKILIYSKDWKMQNQIEPTNNQVENDKFRTISLNNNDGFIYAISDNGILYKYEIK